MQKNPSHRQTETGQPDDEQRIDNIFPRTHFDHSPTQVKNKLNVFAGTKNHRKEKKERKLTSLILVIV